jgi:hypothetical protein
MTECAWMGDAPFRQGAQTPFGGRLGLEVLMRQIRQGDVLLVRVSDADDERVAPRMRRLADVPREAGRLVLAEGEATGHAHAIDDESARLVSDGEAEELYLLVYGSRPVWLQHDEHDPLEIPPGIYQVVRQREYQEQESWDDRSWDWVRD